MPEIRKLSSGVVNKIAAGEVIERPASVVKELVENSLDAGASRVDVTVERGGAELIRVVDDGAGIAPREIPLAVAPHATSKIRDADDLFRVGTLGFRGEALASVAEVSRMKLTSRTAQRDEGAKLNVAGGEATEVIPCGAPQGTSVEVAHLFFNTPVRRKFLRSTQTEMGHVSDAVTRLALAHPKVHFTLRHGARLVYELPSGEPWLARIARLFGRDLAEHLIEVQSTDEQVRLAGYVAHPTYSRGNQRSQYLFLNGRSVRDRSLSHALGEAYRGLLMTGRYPIALLRFDMPVEMIDVNVHPTKQEVRFQDGGRIYSQLLATLRTKFLSTDLSTQLDPTRAASQVRAADQTRAGEESRASQIRQEMALWASHQVAGWDSSAQTSRPSVPPFQPFPDAGALAGKKPLSPERISRGSREAPDEKHADTASSHSSGTALDGTASDEVNSAADDALDHAEPTALQSDPIVKHPVPALQMHNRYLVVESEEGVVVIDQHALHERILYEHLREKILDGELETQNLLVPEPVDLTPAEAAIVLEHNELLEKLGLKIEPFGGETILLSSYPAMLANLKPIEVLRGLVDQLVGDKTPDRRDLLDEMLHSIACKAAIKAGDRLSPAEVAALLEQRHLVHDSHHCPHGRPTALIFTREELDRQFKRT